ncbi:hypothetical protein JL100_035300 (plasmid) [Skermanella mucosa]|uniref:hypothetical protein n=1 Tax=Skermanella mucosa TaxID=1789672 RepID=UPI00192B5A0B|nr:hypothetical protein [Skermanella mucosa]UEM25325.1 hypothetical protein JL100_035300 [Skermanella mucosa]
MMRSLVALCLGAMLLAPLSAEARDRSRAGSVVVAPPGSTVIIIPPAGQRHYRGRVDRFDRQRPLYDRRQSQSLGARRWTTPGFSSGFTTPGFGSSFGYRHGNR